jgi:hypothetical protein
MLRRATVALALVSAAVLAPAALGAPGSSAAAASFTTPFAVAGDAPRIAVDPQARAVVAFTRRDRDGRRVAIVRLGRDGLPDPAFAPAAPTPGVAVVDFAGADAAARGVGIAPDGSIVVAASVEQAGAGVARLSPGGDVLSSAVALDGVDLRAAAVDGAGRVLLAGARDGAPFAARTSANGVVDSRFAPAAGAATGAFAAVAAAPDGGAFLLRGDRVERLDPSGARSASWDGALPFAARTLANGANGDVLAGGDDGVVRLGAGGAPDGAFGSAGVASLRNVAAVAPACGGGVLAAGGSLVRLAQDGSARATRTLAAAAGAVAAAPDGSAVVAGTAGEHGIVERVAQGSCDAVAGVAPPQPAVAPVLLPDAETAGVVATARSTGARGRPGDDGAFVPGPVHRARAATALRRAEEAVRLPPTAAACAAGTRRCASTCRAAPRWST